MLNIVPQVHGNVIIILLSGYLNINNTDSVKKIFAQYAEKKPDAICINCRDLKSMDSSALGLFIKMLRDSEKKGIEFIISELVGNVSSLFDISKLENMFPIMSDEEFRNRYLTGSHS